MTKDPERVAEIDRYQAQIDALEAERQRHLDVLPLVASVVALVPEAAYALLPRPKRFDCPKCRRAELRRGATLIYCLRCSYTESRG